MTPALFMRTSRRSTSPSTVVAHEATESRSERSRLTTSGAGPVAAAFTDSSALAAFSALRHASSTRAPAPARASALRRPRPELAPVISTVRPV
jgi:hypothetical protein